MEVTPSSLTPDESASVERFGQYDAGLNLEKLGNSKTKAPTPGWTTILFHDIEEILILIAQTWRSGHKHL